MMYFDEEFLDLKVQKEKLIQWLEDECERFHNITGDNWTCVGQAVYEEVLKKIKELENEKYC